MNLPELRHVMRRHGVSLTLTAEGRLKVEPGGSLQQS